MFGECDLWENVPSEQGGNNDSGGRSDIAVDLFEAAQGIAADRQSRRPTASPDQRQKNEAQERHFENAGGYRNKGADSGDDMPKGNHPLAVRRKPPVQLLNVVFGQGDPSAVNPCPTPQPFQSQPPRKSVPQQRPGKRTHPHPPHASPPVTIALCPTHPR